VRFLRRESKARNSPGTEELRRLHVGCGTEIIPGWCNIDIQDLPGVDIVLDITEGFNFSDAEYIYCEHFIEHLRFDQGFDFLAACHEALAEGGVLRLSTPNIDWVYLTHFSADTTDVQKRVANTFMLNRAFYGWGHQFLYSREVLSEVLDAVGFRNIIECEYGMSDRARLAGLERHERYESTPQLPDVLILEAERGRGAAKKKVVRDTILRQAREEFLHMLEWRLDGNDAAAD
jgi:predicted SAM-dependent methyltransferase